MDSVRDVKAEVFTHFQAHFNSSQFRRPFFSLDRFHRKLGDPENALLILEFTEEEIKQAVWSIDSNGSPGPDGFTFGFYKSNWDVVKEDILLMMREFHSNGKLVKGFNSSFICLILKTENPQKGDEFRPISFIVSAYKIIAKTLSIRLSKVIESVASENQSAFIKGRHIMDGILILNEAMDEAKKKKIWKVVL